MPADGYMTTLAVTARYYGGIVHGEDRTKIVDVEFPDVRSAAGWANISIAAEAAWFRDPVQRLRQTVVLQFNLCDWIDPRIID